MSFRVSLTSAFSSDNLRILLKLFNSEHILLGIIMSDQFSVQTGVMKVLSGCIYLGMLGGDDYLLGIEIVEICENGSFSSYDNPGVDMRFHIQDDNAQGIKWIKKYWGNIRFNDMAIYTE